MAWTGKKITIGLVGLGVAAAILGGVGVAAATTGQPRAGSSNSSMPCRDDDDFAGMPGMTARHSAMLEAAAKYLGISQAELRGELRDGKTLGEIARAEGRSLTGLRNAIADAMPSRMREHMGNSGGMGMMGW